MAKSINLQVPMTLVYSFCIKDKFAYFLTMNRHKIYEIHACQKYGKTFYQQEAFNNAS